MVLSEFARAVGRLAVKRYFDPPSDVVGFDKDGKVVDMAGLSGREIKRTSRQGNDILAVIDLGRGVPGLTVRLNSGDYDRCVRKGDSR